LPIIFACNKLFEEIVPIVTSYNVGHVLVYDGDDGTIDLTVKDGTPPYSFLWSNGATTEDLNGLTAGVYMVHITDSKNQIKDDTILVNQPVPDPLVLVFDVVNVTDYAGFDGEINLNVTGGVPPFLYSWSNGATEEDISALWAGVYTVTVTDAIDSTICDSVRITQPEPEDRVVDIEGNIYAIVDIGTQTWMQENLRVTKNPQGDDIVCYSYGDEPSNAAIYGRLYAWDVAMNNSVEEKAQGICPDGWHLPSDAEWQILEIYLGMTNTEAEMVNAWRGTNVGTKLKKGGGSGYEALMSGRRSSGGSYLLLGEYEYIWTSSEYGSNAWRRCLRINSHTSGRWNTFPKTYGFSIRCVKND
jgi:uncharacterized protein (TIGR02145 family)